MGPPLSPICFTPKLFFCDLKPYAKFQNPRTTPSWRKVCDPERKERKKIIPKIVDTTFHCHAQWQRTHFPWTNKTKIWKISYQESFIIFRVPAHILLNIRVMTNFIKQEMLMNFEVFIAILTLVTRTTNFLIDSFHESITVICTV